MSNKMPETIFIDSYAKDVEEPGVWFVGCENRGYVTEPTKYIRTDLIEGDSSEPFAHGQFRWVKIKEHDDWTIAEIRKSWSKKLPFDYYICGNECAEDVKDAYKWGPVVKPHEV